MVQGRYQVGSLVVRVSWYCAGGTEESTELSVWCQGKEPTAQYDGYSGCPILTGKQQVPSPKRPPTPSLPSFASSLSSHTSSRPPRRILPILLRISRLAPYLIHNIPPSAYAVSLSPYASSLSLYIIPPPALRRLTMLLRICPSSARSLAILLHIIAVSLHIVPLSTHRLSTQPDAPSLSSYMPSRLSSDAFSPGQI